MTGAQAADREVAETLDGGFIDRLPGAQDLDLLWIDATLGERLAESRRLRAAGHEDEDRFRIEVLRALHERRKVGIGDRHAHRSDDLATGRLECFLECSLGVEA